MNKLTKKIKQESCNALAKGLTWVAHGIATQFCYFIYYQPKEPQGMKDFSKNK